MAVVQYTFTHKQYTEHNETQCLERNIHNNKNTQFTKLNTSTHDIQRYKTEPKECESSSKLHMICISTNNDRHSVPKTFTPLHYTCRHFISSHLNFTQLHFTPLHCTSPNYTSIHFTQLHFTPLRPHTLHSTSLHFTQLHFTTLHSTSPNYTSLPSYLA